MKYFKIMKRTQISIPIIAAFLLLSWIHADAQQQVMYNHYGSNVTPFNPSASLIRPEGEVSIVGRKQWTGIEGAPSSLWINAYAPISSIKATIGANVRNESIGLERSNDISMFFAKGIQINDKNMLSVAVSGGVSTLKQNLSALDPSDVKARYNNDKLFGQIGLGVTFFNPDKYYVGLSAPRVVLQNNTSRINYNFNSSYYFTAGTLFKLDDLITFKPATIVRYAKDAKLNADLSVMGYAKEMIGLGLNVRSLGGVAGLFQYRIKGFSVGYSYQFSTGSQLSSTGINNASQEVYLSFKFGSRKLSLL